MIGINDYRDTETRYARMADAPERDDEPELTPAYLASYVEAANYSKLGWGYKIALEVSARITSFEFFEDFMISINKKRETDMHIYLWSVDEETGVVKSLIERVSQWDDSFEKDVRNLIERIDQGEFL